jgi:two-component system, sensor histidine kinase LadS
MAKSDAACPSRSTLCWIRTFVCCVLACLMAASSARAVTLLDPQVPRVGIEGDLQIFVDATGRLTIDDITRPEFTERFAPPRRDARNLGHIHDPVWVKFTLRTAPGDAHPRVLEMAFGFADYLALYTPHPAGGYSVAYGGDHSRVSERALVDRLHLFPLALAPGAETTFYLRYQSIGVLSLPLSVWRDESLRQGRQRDNLLLGMYYGCLFTLLLYNLALYAGLRAPVYLAYVLYTGTMIFFMAVQNGLTSLYLWPESPALVNLYNFCSVLFVTTAGTVFTRSYLSTRNQTPLVDHLLRALAGIGLVLVVPVFMAPEVVVYWGTLSFAVFALLAIYSTSVYHLVGLRSRPAMFMTGALTLPVLGASVLVLRNAGIAPVNFLTEYGVQIGTMFEMLVLSLGLAEQVAVIRREREEARRAASEDALTGAGNRARLDAQLPIAIARARGRRQRLGVLWVDLDNLKPINDRYGHQVGDAVLSTVAKRMREAVRAHDIVARVGGDEFVIAADGIDHDPGFELLARRLNETIAQPIAFGELRLIASASIGVAVFPDHADSAAELLRRADHAMYAAKSAGRNTFRSAA